MAESINFLPHQLNSCKCPHQQSSQLQNNIESLKQCPICGLRYNDYDRLPVGLNCGHTYCIKCYSNLSSSYYAIINLPLLKYLYHNSTCDSGGWSKAGGLGLAPPNATKIQLQSDCTSCINRLIDIGTLLRNYSNYSSRAINRKVLNLMLSLTWNGEARLLRNCRGVGERVLIELSSASSHHSHYQAQQQLWTAIRSRACQFMGPAMQEEALKLVLLALEDGSPLSRKVLVMFVVQRLSPQFPQASKTSIGHVIQLLYRSSCFDVLKRSEQSSLMTLRPEYRNYQALRREHDSQIIKIAIESGIRFIPEQWSSILYGDTSHKSHMQSIIDKLQVPQTFGQLASEFLVNIQRLNTNDMNYLLQSHPHFNILASINTNNGDNLTWSCVLQALDSTHAVLSTLLNYNKNNSHHGKAGGSNKSPGINKVPENKQVNVPPTVSMATTTTKANVEQLLQESKSLRARLEEMSIKLPSSSSLAVAQQSVNNGSNSGELNDELEEEKAQLDLHINHMESLLTSQ